MKWTTATGLILAVGAAGLAGKAAFTPRDVSPNVVLNDVKRRMIQPGYDERAALRDLERALEDARAADNAKLSVRLLLLHSQILRDLGAFTDARADLERILAVYQPGNRDLACQIAELQLLEGNVDEALARVKRLLRQAPDEGAAWRLRGLLEVRMAEEQVLRAERIAQEALVADDAEKAADLLGRLGARSMRDPTRVALAHELRELLVPRHEERLEELLDTVDEASRIYAEARDSYARSFADGVQPDAAQAFVQLFDRAGRGGLGADFGLSVLALPAIAHDDIYTAGLLEVLSRLGRKEEVLKVLKSWPWDEVPADVRFYESAAVALYDGSEWRALSNPLDYLRKIGDSRERSLANYLMGIANLELGRYEKAIDWLDRFLEEDVIEIVPDSIARAWHGRARAYRALRKPKERQMLEGAVAEAPDYDGEAWLRLVELMMQSPNAGFRIPEERWTKGMSLLPARTPELMDTWTELGEKSLSSAGHDFDEMYSKMKRQSIAFPTIDVGPYTVYRIARAHMDNGRYKGAEHAAEVLLRDYPDLVPAIDVLIESMLARGQSALAADRVLDRIRLAGRDARTTEFLRRLGPEPFTPFQELQAMRIDPTGTGRLAVAKQFLASREPERALRALELTRNVADNPDVGLLLARCLVALGRYAEADSHLAGLIDDPVLGQQALQTLVEARLGNHDDAGLEALVDRLLALESPAPELALEVIDRLLASRRVELAERLIAHLDSARATRSGALYQRMALAAALAAPAEDDGFGRGEETALEALERAEAYVSDGTVEMTRLLFAIERHDWTSLPALVADVRQSGYHLSPLHEAILACLEERLDEAEQLARRGLVRQASSGDWALVLAVAQTLANQTPDMPAIFGVRARASALTLLRGSRDHKRDPRTVLGYLLALDLPGWSAWAMPRIMRLQRRDAGVGTLWPGYLAARALGSLGYVDAARKGLEILLKVNPDFGPGWDMLEYLLTAEHDDDRYHPDLVALRAKRIEALGPELAGSPHRIAVDQAATLYVAGDLDGARVALVEAFNADETDATYGRDLLARIFAEKHQPAQALVSYKRALDGLGTSSRHPLVAELLDMLKREDELGTRRSRKDVPEGLIERTLTQLEQRFPNDPLIALASIRQQVAGDRRNPDLVVGRVTRALREFRERTGRPLEQLRRGSTAAWIDYLLTVAPDLAEDFLREDLLRTPGDLDLWLLLARTRAERGFEDEALDMYRSLVAMSNDPQAHYGAAWLLAQRGGASGAIDAHLAAADAIANEDKLSPRSTFVRIRAELLEQRPNLEGAVDALGRLWRRRRGIAAEVPTLELGRVYARALIDRRTPGDLERLAGLVQDLAGYAEDKPYFEELVLALGGLAGDLEPRAPEERPKGRGKRRKAGGDAPAPKRDTAREGAGSGEGEADASDAPPKAPAKKPAKAAEPPVEEAPVPATEESAVDETDG